MMVLFGCVAYFVGEAINLKTDKEARHHPGHYLVFGGALFHLVASCFGH